MSKRKIQDGHFSYFFIKKFVDFILKFSYRKFQVEGVENLPKDGCTIWASNHTNALMDALVILATTPRQKVYVARADIFKKPFVIKVLTFLKIMPIYRIRDGFDSVKRNDEIISRAVDVLADRVPLSIFPEATHRARHSLLRLSKGIFHITFSVQEKVGPDVPVYIQPIGIDYGDYFRYRSTALIRFGKPINVTEFVKAHADDPQPVQMQQLREILTGKMAELISYIPDDDDYDGIWEYAKLKADNPECAAQALKEEEEKNGCQYKGLMRQQAVNRHFIAEALKLREDDPERAAELFKKADALRLWRIQHWVSVRSIANDKHAFRRAFGKMLLTVLGFPYYVFTVLVYLLVWVPTLFFLSKQNDDAFYNTARFGVRFGLSWLCVLICAILAFHFLPTVWAIVAVVLMIPGYNYFTDYREFVRVSHSDIAWFFTRRKAPDYKF